MRVIIFIPVHIRLRGVRRWDVSHNNLSKRVNDDHWYIIRLQQYFLFIAVIFSPFVKRKAFDLNFQAYE